MRVQDRKLAIGVMSDEEAMFDLLAKFLKKEGYEARRVLQGMSEVDDCVLIVYAPTRDLSRSKDWFDNLKKKKPTVLVVQCCDEDYVDAVENVVVLSERPMNLKQLGDTIKRTIEKSGHKETASSNGKLNGDGAGLDT